LDFNALQEISHKKALHTSERSDLSEAHFQKGMDLFEKAEKSGFKDIASLQDACVALIDAMKANRSNIRAYAALANIFFILEDFAMASSYIQAALTLQQDNPIILKLQALIQAGVETAFQKRKQREQARNQSSLSAKPVCAAPQNDDLLVLPARLPDSPDEFDKLYDSTEAFLVAWIRKLMQTPLPELAQNSSSLNALEAMLAQLNNNLTVFQQLIQILNEDLDVQALENIARPLESMRKRYQVLFQNSQSSLVLLEEIRQAIALVQQVSEEAKEVESQADFLILEENLEIVMENYADFGLRMDELQKQGLNPENILSEYGQLNQSIEKYQDLLDDLAASFEK
jgi:tetratricopeptide (TPR) repeat protein